MRATITAEWFRCQTTQANAADRVGRRRRDLRLWLCAALIDVERVGILELPSSDCFWAGVTARVCAGYCHVCEMSGCVLSVSSLGQAQRYFGVAVMCHSESLALAY
jgi:hypothetical protein